MRIEKGRGADSSPAYCTLARKYGAFDSHCADEMQSPEVQPTLQATDARVTRPGYPPAAVESGWQSMVNVLAYGDRTGYVCRVTVVNGSGIDIIDSKVLVTVRAWRFSPGLVKGQPVASAYDFKISFILADYQLGADYDFPRAGKATSQ